MEKKVKEEPEEKFKVKQVKQEVDENPVEEKGKFGKLKRAVERIQKEKEKGLVKVEKVEKDDDAELKRMLQDLSAFQSKVADHEHDVYKHGDEAMSWLNGLEDQVRSLQNRKDIPVEERLQLTEELNRQAATEHVVLDNTDRASERLLSVLEGTPSYEDVKERLEREQKERRRRHQSVQDEMRRAVSDAISEKAVNERVRDAVDGLLDWAVDFERTATGQSHPIPLREEKLMELKNEEQRMRGEAEAKQALVKQLEQEVRRVSITSPNAARTEKLGEKLADAAGRLNRANGALRGYRDNLDDALNGVRDVNKMFAVIGRSCDELSSKMKKIAAKDQSRLEEAQAALAAIGEDMMEAEKLANMLLSIPDTTHTEEIDGRKSLLGGQINNIADQLEEKKKRAVEVGKLEREYEEKRDRVSDVMGKLIKKLTSVGNPGVSSDKLTGQRQQLSEVAADYQNVLPLLQKLEELSFKLVEAQTVPGSRASSVPKIAMDLKAKSNQIGELLKKQERKLVAQQAKVSDIEGLKENLDRWIMEKEKQMRSDIQIDHLNSKNISKAKGKLHKLAEESRGQQRRVEAVRVLARELARSCPEDASVISDMEKGVSEKWNEFNNAMEKGKKRTEGADKLYDGVSQLDSWLSGKQRMLLVVCAPSTDPSVAKGQQNHLQMLRVEAENQLQTLDQLAELAKNLVGDAPTEKEKEAIRKKLDEVTKRWSALSKSLAVKEADVDQAVALGASIADLQTKINKELSELEDAVEKASSLPPSDIDQKLTVLDECKSRDRLGVLDLLEKLKKKLREAEGVNTDQSATNMVKKLHTRAQEVNTKIDSVKRAAVSANEEKRNMERQLDALLESMRDVGLEVFKAVPLFTDQSELKDQTEHFDKVYGAVLTKEKDVYLVRAKAQDQLMQLPNAELRAKLDRLNAEWPVLLEATQRRKTALDRVKELVEHFVENELNLANKIKENYNAVQEAMNIAPPSDSVDALRQLEGTVDRRKQQAEGLEALANQIEQLAPGAGLSRHLKRQAEKLTDDVNGLVKKSKKGLKNAQKKNEVRDKFDRAADEAYAFCTARESELDRDDNISKERMGIKFSDTESFISRVGRQLSQLGDELKQIVPAEEAEQVEETRQDVKRVFQNLRKKMSVLESKLQGKKEEEEKLKEKAQELGTRIRDLEEERSRELREELEMSEETETDYEACRRLRRQFPLLLAEFSTRSCRGVDKMYTNFVCSKILKDINVLMRVPKNRRDPLKICQGCLLCQHGRRCVGAYEWEKKKSRNWAVPVSSEEWNAFETLWSDRQPRKIRLSDGFCAECTDKSWEEFFKIPRFTYGISSIFVEVNDRRAVASKRTTRSDNSKLIRILCSSGETVLMLKAKVADETGYPVSRIYAHEGEEPLDERMTLCEARIDRDNQNFPLKVPSNE